MKKDNKTKNWFQRHPILSAIIGIIVFSAIINLFTAPSSTQSPQTTTSTPTNNIKTSQTTQILSYQIIEEKNTSYLNCNRVNVKIVLPNNSNSQDINYTLNSLLNNYKNSYDEATIFAYNNGSNTAWAADHSVSYSNCN